MPAPTLGSNRNRVNQRNPIRTTINKSSSLRKIRKQNRILTVGYVLLFCCLVGASGAWWLQSTEAQDQEPITAVGHGGFFGPDWRQIPLTLGFAAKAQAWYRKKLLSELPAAKRDAFAVYEKRLLAGLQMNPQEKLVVQHQSLEWLLENTESVQLKLQTAAKLRALRYALNWKLPVSADLKAQQKLEPFTIRPELLQRLDSMKFKPADDIHAHAPSPTTKSGQAYLNECSAAGVPTPPSINLMDPAGTAGWKSQGFIPTTDQFIVGSPAEVRTFHSTAPEGMCYSLPRYVDATLTTFALDGVICMGKQSSKVCFWDNQWTNPATGLVEGFPIPANTQIPIGVPATTGGKYQAGGKEIEFASGGICTDCHAGENPYIIHPKSNLAPTGPAVRWESLSVAPQNLPSIPDNRYDPLVASSWPQNSFSQAFSTVPAVCSGCHVKTPFGPGRFPHLSNQIPTYCNTVLAQAITRTMPPSSPGSATTAGNAFLNAWCNAAPNSSSLDSGDPHLTTINGINYDFQAAGEFTVLRNADTAFELQTRQSPVLTSFTPGANPYTGLPSCVSLNTAVALRVGKRRITYQPAGGSFSNAEQLTVYVDGQHVDLANGYDLGDGNVIGKATPGGDIDIRLADGTRVVITPIHWVSEGYWYLDVQVFNTPAREGVMGPILPGEFLPRAPDGSSFGSKPAALLDRHILLNQKFADAWRVTNATSLFVYAAGSSTADFTDKNWPSPPGQPCTSTTVRGTPPLVKRPRPELAKKACSGIRDKTILANCMFDVTVMGDANVAKGHVHAAQLKAAAH